jgi:hypothetical protein
MEFLSDHVVSWAPSYHIAGMLATNRSIEVCVGNRFEVENRSILTWL